MRFLAGWIAGLATAWAALAIWQRIPPMRDIDAESECWEFRPGRPGYDDSVARGGWTAPPGEYPFGSTLDDVPR